MNTINRTWLELIDTLQNNYQYKVSPRGMLVKEIISGSYSVPMPAFISLSGRNVNYSFMFAEAAWIVSGSNRLSKIAPYMKRYADYSDDGVFLGGAYGPKIVDQLRYVVKTLVRDYDTRQAVINIWRERPGDSKDIPCTLSMQFLIRNDKLHLVVTMRSHDVVLGFTYDVFTFSMVALAIKLLLDDMGTLVDLGDLHVNAGSLHLYQNQEDNLPKYTASNVVDGNIEQTIKDLNPVDYEDLIKQLERLANK